MNKEFFELFVQRAKSESKIHKFLDEEIIYEFIGIFKKDNNKKQYPKNINNTLEIAFKFYKHYNNEYYKMIMNAINNNKIIISDENKKSFVNTESNRAYIKLYGNDSDLFILVHEFAHFIDRNFIPVIIPDEYNFLCEVFSFYMEKQLELWLNDTKYDDLIETRRNNRIYFESRMLNAIEYELYCETLYKETGQIRLDSLDNYKVKYIMEYDYDRDVGLVNYLLRYPLANLLSEYLINNKLVKNDSDIYRICLNSNLYEIIKDFKLGKKF